MDSSWINGIRYTSSYTHIHIHVYRMHAYEHVYPAWREFSLERRSSSSSAPVSRRATRLAVSHVVERLIHKYTNVYNYLATISCRVTHTTFCAMKNTCWKLCVIFAAVAGATRGWEAGSGHKYRLTNTLIFREAGSPKSGGDVGFQLTSELDVTAVWQDSNDPNSFLLKFKVCYLSLSLICIFQTLMIVTVCI